MADLKNEYATIMARHDVDTSDDALASSMVRSVFDGLTLGVFAENGIFTESNKWQHQEEQFAGKIAGLREDYKSSQNWKSLALWLAVGSGVFLFVTRKKVSLNLVKSLIKYG